jgi:anti-anti-sigma factor
MNGLLYSCDVCTSAGEWQVSLGGEIDMSAIPELEGVLRLAQANANTVWVDLHDVSFMDSSGIAMLVRAQQRTVEHDNDLFVLRPSATVRQLLEMCGLDRALGLAELHPELPATSRRRHALIVTDLEGLVIHWNRDAELLYGYSAEWALGRRITDLTVAPSGDEQAASIMQTINEQGLWEGAFEVARADGSSFRAWVRDILATDDRGQPCGVVGLSVPLAEPAPLVNAA